MIHRCKLFVMNLILTGACTDMEVTPVQNRVITKPVKDSLAVTVPEPLNDYLTVSNISLTSLYLSSVGQFTVKLNTSDSATVNISSVNGYVTFNTDSLSFSTSNYNTNQTIVVTRGSHPPGLVYDTIRITSEGYVPKEIEVRVVDSNISSLIYNIEPANEMHWVDENDLNTLRTNTIQWIWGDGYGIGNDQLPEDLPTNIQAHVNDTYITGASISNLSGIDVMEHDLGGTWKVYIYHFKPSVKVNKTFIGPIGHGDSWSQITNSSLGRYDIFFNSLVSAGYDVITWYMVGRGPNPTGNGITQGTGGVNGTHDQMETLESSSPYFNPMRYFLEPGIVAANYGESFGNPMYTGGISGGGWTSTWQSALDERLLKNFNIAGNYPQFIKYGQGTDGDYEQGSYNWLTGVPERSSVFMVDQMKRVSWLDLYSLGSFRREHYQYNNAIDTCCFGGYYNTVYKETLKRRGLFFEASTYSYNGHGVTIEIMNDVLSKI